MKKRKLFSWVGGDLETDVDLANGGINNGELGKIDGIRYSNQTLLTVTTQSTGKNQYFPRFIGLDYDTGRWSELLSSTLKTIRRKILWIIWIHRRRRSSILKIQWAVITR